MELKNKVKQIILRVICALFLIIAIFFGSVAAFYSIGGGAPNLFGKYIYLVKTDAFDLLHNGTALIAEEVDAYEIQPWNIVIFTLENDAPALAEIRSSTLSDGVYSFTAATENGTEITLSQSQILAKGMTYSDFWGAVISFASSPLGVMLIAVVPCLIIIVIEITKFIRKTMPQPEIETVKKQQETPTYVPEGRAGVMSAYKSGSLDDSIGIYDGQRRTSVDRTDVLEISNQPEMPLFLRQQRPPAPKPQKRVNETMPLSQKKLNAAIAAAKAEREMQAEREKTVKDIQKDRPAAIAAEKEHEEYLKNVGNVVKDKAQVKAASNAAVKNMMEKTAEIDAQPIRTSASTPRSAPRKESQFRPEFTPSRTTQPATQRTASTRTTQIRRPGEEEQLRQYTPRTPGSANHVTTSIPRLDAVLKEDGESNYNLDDILASLDKRG